MELVVVAATAREVEGRRTGLVGWAPVVHLPAVAGGVGTVAHVVVLAAICAHTGQSLLGLITQ